MLGITTHFVNDFMKYPMTMSYPSLYRSGSTDYLVSYEYTMVAGRDRAMEKYFRIYLRF